MGWSSGNHLADRVWSAIKDAIPEARRDEACRAIAEAFMDQDCDTLDELDNPIGDAASRIHAELRGAPRTPLPGDVFTDRRGTLRFDGRRWRR